MSQENVEQWLRSADAWNRGDREEWLRDIPPDWEFHTSGAFPGLRPVYRGPEGAAALWEAMREPWATFAVKADRIEDIGDKLIALVTFEVRGRDGLETGRRWAYVVTFSDGLPRRTDNYPTWDAALEAAGIRK